MTFSYPDAAFVGALLSEFLLGIYAVIFAIYIKDVRPRKKPSKVVDYGLISLFLICVSTVVLDATQQFHTLRRPGTSWITKANSVASVMSLTLDFISQMILIYRCWNVWGRLSWVGIPPALVALTSYVAGVITVTIDMPSELNSFTVKERPWWIPLGLVSMGLSLCVNAMVSTLIIGRIWHGYRQTKRATGTAAKDLSWITSVLLESAIVLFFAQLTFLVLFRLQRPAFSVVAAPVTILYGLNCTAIMVRVGLGRSYESAAVTKQSTINFAIIPDRENPVLTGN